jgi:hypothetical protein
MKHTVLALLLAVSTQLFAEWGDTTIVRTHEKVLIQTDPSRGYTDYPMWGQFPAQGKSFYKVYAELTFQCPPGMNCGEWDYLNFITLGKRHGAKKDTLNWEIMRMITPYGLQFSQTWKHTWRMDITDFASLLHDSAEIIYQHTGYEARNGRGWLVTLDFVMIEGPQIRPVHDIKLLYRASVPYGDDTLFDARTPVVNYTTGPKTTEVRYKIIQSGHGMDQPQNCAEFCPKYREIIHDNTPMDRTYVWRNNCGENPVFPQGGTWIYDRSNWCPGAEVEEYNLDIPVAANSQHSFDLDMESYIRTGGGSNYMIAGYIVEYGPNNWKLDASLEDIIRPSSDIRHLRLNPSCAEPRITIRNNGTELITSALIEYGWEGYEMKRYAWAGYLIFGRKISFDLPWLNQEAPAGTRFIARIVWANNRNDEYSGNNTIASIPSGLAPVLPGNFVVVLRTNNAASENYWTLRSADGTVIRKRENLTNNTSYRDTLSLAPGCYRLELMDDGTPPAQYALNEDGLGWWANTFDGTGLFQLRNPNGNTVIKTFAPDFGTGIWYQFTVGTLQAPPTVTPQISLYPNPVQHDMIIDLGSNRTGDLSIQLFNNIGKKVIDETRSGSMDALQYLNIETLSPGTYTVRISLGDEIINSKIIIQ